MVNNHSALMADSEIERKKTEMPHNLKRKLTTEQTFSVITPGGHSLVICNYEA